MALELSLKEFSIDLQNQSMVNTIVLPQGDSYSRKLLISLYDNGKKYIIPTDEVSVDMIGSRADGAVVNRHVDNFSGNVITIILREDELAVKGLAKYKITISVTENEKKIILSSFPFKIKVSEDTYDSNNKQSYPRIDILEDTISKAEKSLENIANLESSIGQNEDERKGNENERILNEDKRKKQETLRESSEESRSQAENDRINSENTRIKNESIRDQSEETRITSENDRISAENDRILSEDARKQSETERNNNEDARVQNDSIRETNENTRRQNENERELSENDRKTAETERVNSESIRVANEDDRVIAEEKRETAETERINAENQRALDFDSIKKQSETSIADAEKVNIEIEETNDSYKVKTIDRNGAEKISPNLLNKISIGTIDTGEYDENASATVTGSFGEQKLNLRLPTGKPFKIKKTYSSIELMNKTITSDLDLYDFCMINTGNVEDEDTGKLYMLDINGASYITDLSGVQGIQGVKGETGDTPNITIGTVTTGAEGSKASATITGTKENPVINFTIPVRATGKVENISASSIPFASNDDTNTIKDIVDDISNSKLGKDENAASSTKAENDGNNQNISDTYIKDIEVNKTTLTIVKGNGTKSSFNTQDTTYSDVTSNVHGLMTPEQKNKLDSIVIATQEKNGLVKPDGNTITIDEDGTLHGSNNIEIDDALSSDSKNPVQNKVIKDELDKYLKKNDTAAKATSDGDGNNIANTYATKTELSNAGGVHVGEDEPISIKKLWIDTGNGGIAKYYDGSVWTPIKATWG